MEKQMNVPRLRFPEFTEKWNKQLLGDISSWASGGTPPKDNLNYWNGDIPWITASSMRGNEYNKSDLNITLEGLKRGSKLAPKGSLLLLVRGSMLFNKIPIGIATRDVAFNQDVKSIKIDKGNNTRFILHWFYASEHIIKNMVTGTGIGAGKLDLDDLKKLPLSIPEISEQTKISTFLSAVEVKISQLIKKQCLLEQYKKGVMKQIFSHELRFKDDVGNDYSDWEEMKLEETCDFFRGSPISKSDLEDNGKYQCIHYGELFTIYNEVIRSINSRTNLENGFFSRTGDILMPSSDVTPDGLAKASSIQLDGVILGGDMNILRPNSNLNSIYLSYLLNFNKLKIMQIVSGTTIKHIYNKDVKTLDFLFSKSLPEQTKIANFLSSIDSKIAQTALQIEKMQLWKKGLLQQMFV